MMKVLKITDDYKMSKVLRNPDGYYIVEQNPILLHKNGSEDVEEIPVGTIVCIRSEDSPFYPMKTITNCDNDVTYYITTIFQNRDVIEYSNKDNAGSGGGEGAEVKTAKVYFRNEGNFQGLIVDVVQYGEIPNLGKVYTSGSYTIGSGGTSLPAVLVPCAINLTDAAAVARIRAGNDGVEIIQMQGATIAIVRHDYEGAPAIVVFESNE